MRFLVAVAALSAVSSPALAMDTFATSRAIPPSDAVEFTVQGSVPTARLTDLVMRDAAAAPTLRQTPSRPAPRAFQSDDERQQTCIAQAVYYESKGEPLRGQRAVADVIINRTRKPGFASTPCGVIRQPHQFTNARRWGIPSAADPLWQRAREVARNAMAGIGTVSEVITAFHAARINPGWNMRRVAMIGGHVFY